MQATQNPICFSLIPELFPNGRTTAMAFYNTAIYAGRALSFAAVIIAAQLGVPEVGRCNQPPHVLFRMELAGQVHGPKEGLRAIGPLPARWLG
jgi:hypothetical protein